MVGGLWRGEANREEGESGPLWQGAISHPLTQAHSPTHTCTHHCSCSDRVVPTALPRHGCDTLTQITCYKGQREALQSASSTSSP